MKSYILKIIFIVLCLTPFNLKASVSTPHNCSQKDNPKVTLACNIYKEARGEGFTGMLGVGLTTINRVKHNKFPNKIQKVVYQKSQFSWTNNNNNTRITHKESWEEAKLVATILLKVKDYEFVYNKLDFTNGSLYYHNTSVNPTWSKSFTKTVAFKNHIWYK